MNYTGNISINNNTEQFVVNLPPNQTKLTLNVFNVCLDISKTVASRVAKTTENLANDLKSTNSPRNIQNLQLANRLAAKGPRVITSLFFKNKILLEDLRKDSFKIKLAILTNHKPRPLLS